MSHPFLPPFSWTRPTLPELDAFLAESREREFTYPPRTLSGATPPVFTLDESAVLLGEGAETFARARDALVAWRHFQLGWIEIHPRCPRIEEGVTVAVVAHRAGLWWLNAARITEAEFGPACAAFSYGTLSPHAEQGEERFAVEQDARGAVVFRIRAVSRPRALMVWACYPWMRRLQADFAEVPEKR